LNNFSGVQQTWLICTDTIKSKGTLLSTLLMKKIKSQRDHGGVFTAGDIIKGKLNVSTSKIFPPIGVKLSLVGEIASIYDRGEHTEFLYKELILSQSGNFPSSSTFEFDFPGATLDYDSYNGVNVKLRYYLRFTVTRSYAADICLENEFWVMNCGVKPEINESVKMEVGIEDCLHIEFEFERTNFHLQDIVLGKIFFLLVRLKIKYMEIVLIKRESTGAHPNVVHENTNVAKYEIMDGAPVKGNIIPIRLLLGALPLTPSYRDIERKFAVKYALNVVLVDEEDRRYFKQTDIFLYREKPENLVPHDMAFLRLDYTAVYSDDKAEKKDKKKKKVKT